MSFLTNFSHEEYVRGRAQGLGKREAAVRAGYKDSHTLNRTIWKIEHAPGVMERLKELQLKVEDGIIEKQTSSVTRVLEEFGHIAFLDIGGAFTEDGDLLPIHKMPENIRRAIAGIEYEDIYTGRGAERKVTGRLAKVKIADKIAALNSIGRNLGMFQEKSTQEIDIERSGIRVTIRSVLDRPGE